MTETFLAPFDYDVHFNGRAPGLRRGLAAIEIKTVRRDDMRLAYRVVHHRDLGPGSHLVLRWKGRLWWPLVDRTLIGETRDAADFLRELRDGQSDLFVRRCLDDHHLQDHRRRRIVRDHHDDTLEAVRSSARNLLIVDNRLYAAGGVPMLVETFGRICIASTGADRAVPVAAGELRIKPANGHHGGIDRAVSRGLFYLPGDLATPAELRDIVRRRWSDFVGIEIETIDGDEVDSLEVRIDATFSACWTAMNRSIPRTRPEGFVRLRAQFAELCGRAGGDSLTAARYFALKAFFDLFGSADPRPVAVSECLDGVRRTIAVAERSERFTSVTPASLTLTLDEVDEAALACVA